MVRIQKIQDAQRAEPFRPFTIRMADGRDYCIDHPEFMFISRDGRTVVFETVAGRVEFLDSVLATSVSVPAPDDDLPPV